MYITKAKFFNYKRFQEFKIDFNDGTNVLIGDNEAGKSSILQGIDFILSGSRYKVESFGLDNLFNKAIIENFLSSDKSYGKLPKLEIEVYLGGDCEEYELVGKNNSEGSDCSGIKLICAPIDTLSKEIKDILKEDNANFPFEFYSIAFHTFSGEAFSTHSKFLKHILVDTASTSAEYALREYTKDIYNNKIGNIKEKYLHQNAYRKHKDDFRDTILVDLNTRLGSDCIFGIRTGVKSNLETDLVLIEGGINIENKGKGRQCFVKTEFSLNKSQNDLLDVVLIEEPENHLSHVNMKKLIENIKSSKGGQLIIATHSSLICSRLDLRNTILLNSNTTNIATLKLLTNDTANFFIKAPNHNILEYILSQKVILVEGDAEYILIEEFFRKETGSIPEDLNIHVISVGGTSFKRYLEIGKILGIRTVVIRDNDGDFNNNCILNYSEYIADNIKIFYDTNNDNRTFEVSLYESNIVTCESLFKEGRKKLSVQDYMLKNKTETALELLNNIGDVVVPEYIKDAIKWIKE